MAAVPDSHATAAQVSATAETMNALPLEITVVREVDEINAGRFNPALAGEQKDDAFTDAFTDAFIATSPLIVTTISQIDPNL